jgi:hypothetical protein
VKNKGKTKDDKKSNKKRRKDNKMLSKKSKKWVKNNLTKDNKRKKTKINVLTYELLVSTLSYLMLPL